MNGRIRVLMVMSDLAGGGAEREFSTLLYHLDRGRFDLHVGLWRRAAAYPCPNDLPVHVLDKTRPWHLPRTVRRTAQLIDTVRPDVVLSFLQYPNLVTGSALAYCRHRPRWLCRFMNPPAVALGGWKRAWARRVLPRAERVLTCSEGLSTALAAYTGLAPARVRTVPNPVDLDAILARAGEPLPLDLPADTFHVVHAARLVPQKNQAVLLDAFACLSSALAPRPATLLVLGTGPLEARLRRRARRLGIAPRVRWLGFQSNPFPFFRAADGVVLSSRWEGSPNALIEAMACGAAVVSTRCPFGPEDLIDDGHTGLLVPPDDARALAGALARLARDPALRAALGHKAHNRITATHSLSGVLAQYTALLAASQAP
jgi:glycosyltransferase involved in cell wall biosynthesis